MMAVHGWIGAKSLFQKAGNWDETLLINQDGEYMTRVIAESDGVLFDSQSKVWYRSNLSGCFPIFKVKSSLTFQDGSIIRNYLSESGN